jgi:hypothetical protein
LIWQAVPFLGLAVLIALGWLWPLVGAIALWTLAALCLATFTLGIWKQSRRG